MAGRKSALYKVGDTYTSQKSKITGVIKEIVQKPNERRNEDEFVSLGHCHYPS